ncbi:Uncharacterized protein HZ326_22716 [Fusarium oxysporum f. sp. albedinis]|nr:Uncharacterized protein HZ326_22716 [Fusarium oxysporum f. sp. albedinis]
MSQSEPPYSSESNSRLRTRRPSPSNQLCPRKRQRQIRPASTATSFDITKHPEAKESVGDGSERRGGSILYNS